MHGTMNHTTVIVYMHAMIGDLVNLALGRGV
jgi:hypothetical protein